MRHKQNSALPRPHLALRVPRASGWGRGALVAGVAVPLLLVVAGAASAATWNQQQTPIPPGASTWQFSAVSCQPAGGCMAVGTDTSSTSTSLLVEQRLGTTWTVLSAPVPAGAVSSE